MEKKQTLNVLKRDEICKTTLVVVQDTRKMPNKKELATMSVEAIANIQLPVCVRVTLQKEIKYLATGYKCSIEKFQAICDEQYRCDNEGSRKRTYKKERDEILGELERVKRMIGDLVVDKKFTLETLQDSFNGKQDKDLTLNNVWADVIAEKKKSGRIGTAQSYESALRRFAQDMGGKVRLTRISNAFVHAWRNKMLKDITPTTAGIYLRTMRAIVNVCIKRELMKGYTEKIFEGARLSDTNQRTGEFLNADDMQRLYDFWFADEAKDTDGKELFAPREKRALFRDLGYFLFSYLGNGLNVADMANLTYNEHYQNTNGTEFLFFRQKTSSRTGKRSIVIIPIDIVPMQVIIERLANKPTTGGFVFPINKGGESEATKEEHVHKCNANIRKALAKLAPLVGLNVTPTAAWARHSFATNLSNAGVPIKYIDSSMGHADGKDVINFYLGGYPHDKRVEYNSYLLPMMQTNKRKKLLAAGFNKEQVEMILAAI